MTDTTLPGTPAPGSSTGRENAARPDKSPTARLAAQAKAMSVYEPWRIAFDLARPWLVIFAAVAVCAHYPTWPVIAISFVLIATQQYALLILMHDGQHTLLHPRKKINNAISKWLIGAPCGTPFLRSQAQHLAHHQSLGSTDDPAFQFYCHDKPSPKGSVGALVAHFARVLFLSRLGYSVVGDSPSGSRKNVESAFASYMPILAAQVLLFALFYLAGIWWAYFVLWALPLATLVSFFDAFRQFAEHAEPLPDRDATRRLITTHSNPIERTFVAPFSMNYHAEHHMFPFVPYYKLRQMSEVLRNSPAGETVIWRRSYLQSLAIYVRGL